MKVVKDLLSEQIYKILKNDIINSKINFGEVLVNKNLQERFEVSSTPIRDAILRLKEDGIIEEITRSGAKLIDFDPNFACEVNQLIMTITLGVIEYSLENIENRKVILDNLKKYIKLQQNNVSADLYYEYDYHFHKTFFDYSNNKLLKDLFKKYNLINEILVKAYHKGAFSLEIRMACLEDHENIIKSIEENNLSSDLYYEYDYHFHKTFFDYSNNKLLKDLFKKYNLINEILVKAYHKGAFSLEIRMACLEDHKNIINSIEENNISKTLDSVKKHYLRADRIFKNKLKIN